MTEHEQEQANQERRIFLTELSRRILIVVMGVYMLATTGTITILAVQDHYRIQQNRYIQSTIKDCVQPNGQCYRNNLAARHEIVTDINWNSVVAAACAVVAPVDVSVKERLKVIHDCVTNVLKDETIKQGTGE